MTGQNIGFVSTRFAGTDGVSLEAGKWATILEGLGHNIYWYAGKLDREPGHLEPKAHFKHPIIKQIHDEAFNRIELHDNLEERIENEQLFLQQSIKQFVQSYDIDTLIVENASTIPMNIPLGIAIKRYLENAGLPAIVHHHDFYWERDRFLKSNVDKYLLEAFPPNMENLTHIVINTDQQRELKITTGNTSYVIPNVMDFEQEYTPNELDKKRARNMLGLNDAHVVLQPTRIVRRKNIERAVDLVYELRKRVGRSELYISHSAGDEDDNYPEQLRAYAHSKGIDINMHPAALKDAYDAADIVSYPSTWEGFGNALLEAVYFKKPVVGHAYQIFARDIKPTGLKIIESAADHIENSTVQETVKLLSDPRYRQELVEHNYNVGLRNFSYSRARNTLNKVLH